MNPVEGNLPAPRFGSPGREFVFHIVLTLSLFLSITFVPLAGFLTGIFTPLPTALALIRIGPPGAWLVPGIAGIAGVIVLLGLGLAQSIPYFFALLGMGIVLGYGTRKMWPTEKVIGMSCLVMVAISACLLAYTYFETGGELVRLVEQDLKAAVSAALAQLGTPSAETHELEESLLAAVPMIVRIMPGVSISCTLGIALLNMLVVRRHCRTAAMEACIRDDWTRWKSPEVLVWVLIGSGLALLTQGAGIMYPALNLIVVLGSIYFLQGLSIASFYLEKWKLPAIFRGFVYALLVMQQVASMVTAIVGLFDMWFDFRKMTKKPA